MYSALEPTSAIVINLSNRQKFQFKKDKVDRKRMARLDWIKILIEGRALKWECWEVPRKVPQEADAPLPGKRAYIFRDKNFAYLIWLEPYKEGKFKFSSAYCPSYHKLRLYLDRAKRIK